MVVKSSSGAATYVVKRAGEGRQIVSWREEVCDGREMMRVSIAEMLFQNIIETAQSAQWSWIVVPQQQRPPII